MEMKVFIIDCYSHICCFHTHAICHNPTNGIFLPETMTRAKQREVVPRSSGRTHQQTGRQHKKQTHITAPTAGQRAGKTQRDDIISDCTALRERSMDAVGDQSALMALLLFGMSETLSYCWMQGHWVPHAFVFNLKPSPSFCLSVCVRGHEEVRLCGGEGFANLSRFLIYACMQ